MVGHPRFDWLGFDDCWPRGDFLWSFATSDHSQQCSVLTWVYFFQPHYLSQFPLLHCLRDEANQFTHTMLVLCGAFVSHMLYGSPATSTIEKYKRLRLLLIWSVSAFAIATVSHHFFRCRKSMQRLPGPGFRSRFAARSLCYFISSLMLCD